MLKLGEPLGERVGAKTRQIGAQFGEAPRTEHHLAQHQQRPAVADQLERMGRPTGIVIASFRLD